MGYTFGDGGAAALRLAHLARLYAPSSAVLLRRWAPERPALAVDLGCGPGHTTTLLHDCAGAATTVGVDASARYVEAARGTMGAAGQPSFVCADLSRTLPAEAAGADLLYLRFLLTHLPGPEDALGGWRRCVAPAAILVVEELEWLRSEHPTLSRYYDLVEAVQRAHGQEMYVGRGVEAMLRRTGWRVLHSEATRLHRAADSMALLHALNLDTLRHDPALADASADEMDDLRRSLERLAEGHEDATIDHGLRQAVAVAS